MSAPAELPQNLPTDGVFTFGANEGYLLLPFDYDPDAKHPLILFFHSHGRSELPVYDGGDMGTSSFTDFCDMARRQGYILASPACGERSWMNASAERITLEMVEFLSGHLAIDRGRIFTMGSSMGGACALTFALRNRQMVRAVCDVFGVSDHLRFCEESNLAESIAAAFGGSPDQCLQVYRQRSAMCNLDILKDIPIFMIHGDADTAVPLWNSQVLYDALQACGGDVELVVLDGVGHDNVAIKGLEDRVLAFFASK